MTTSNTNIVISAFSEDQVERLTNVSRRQLRYWDRTNFFKPSFADENRRRPYSRVYSFQDVLSLKVLGRLRNELKVPLPHLRHVKEELGHLGDKAWSTTTLYVVKKKVVFVDQNEGKPREIVSGQLVMEIIKLEIIRSDMKEAIGLLSQRNSQQYGTVEKRRGVSHGSPVVSGTRIPVHTIKAFSDAGYTVRQIKREYPTLTEKDIRAAIEFGNAA